MKKLIQIAAVLSAVILVILMTNNYNRQASAYGTDKLPATEPTKDNAPHVRVEGNTVFLYRHDLPSYWFKVEGLNEDTAEVIDINPLNGEFVVRDGDMIISISDINGKTIMRNGMLFRHPVGDGSCEAVVFIDNGALYYRMLYPYYDSMDTIKLADNVDEIVLPYAYRSGDKYFYITTPYSELGDNINIVEIKKRPDLVDDIAKVAKSIFYIEDFAKKYNLGKIDYFVLF